MRYKFFIVSFLGDQCIAVKASFKQPEPVRGAPKRGGRRPRAPGAMDRRNRLKPFVSPVCF
jgi:hypothetical protein